MAELNCIIFSDISNWEKNWLTNSLSFLNSKITTNIYFVDKDGEVDLSSSHIWLISRYWKNVKKTLRKIKRKKVFLSVLDPTTINDSASMLFIRKFYKILPNHVTLLAHSKLNYEFLRKIFGVSDNRLFLIDFPFYETGIVNKKENSITNIGFFGNFLRDDNYNFIITLAHCLINQTKKIKFYLFGEGPLKNHVLTMIRALNLKEFFIFDEFEKALPSLDLIFYSTIRNSHYLPLLIAAQRKIPVFSLFVPGINDYIDNKKSGFIFNIDDVGIISNLIIELINNKEYLELMGYNHYRKMLLKKESYFISLFKTIFDTEVI